MLSVLLLATAAVGAHAEAGDEVAQTQHEFLRAHGDRPIAAISVEGLRRTRPAVAQQRLDCT
ncbi:MAG TPA: hypothetical protein VGF76_15260, partial [Polyangiaceae bacterium]